MNIKYLYCKDSKVDIEIAVFVKANLRWKNCILPNATVQQSLLFSPSIGSILATGVSFCLGSHTFTVPEINTHILSCIWSFSYWSEDITIHTISVCSHHLCFQWLSQVHQQPSPGHRLHLYNSLFLCGPSQCTLVFQASPDSCGKTAFRLNQFRGPLF